MLMEWLLELVEIVYGRPRIVTFSFDKQLNQNGKLALSILNQVRLSLFSSIILTNIYCH